MKRETKYTVFGAAVAVMGISTVATAVSLITRRLLKFAMDRKEPKSIARNKARLSRSDEMNEFMKVISTASDKMLLKTFEDVQIDGYGGIILKGHWHQCNSPKRIIIAMHGWRSSWSQDFGCIADFWHDNDCDVLYAEQRGQGESGGEYIGFGLLERFDCLKWIEWAIKKTGGTLPIYLGGVSMGATTVLMTAGLDLPLNVRGIVADCGFTSPHAIWKHVIESNLHLPYRLHSGVANDLCKKRINMTSNEYSAVDAMKVCKIPVLFIHGTEDKFVPIDMTYENYKACQAPKRLMVVPGAGHGMSYFKEKSGYEKAVMNFWNEYDCFSFN